MHRKLQVCLKYFKNLCSLSNHKASFGNIVRNLDGYYFLKHVVNPNIFPFNDEYLNRVNNIENRICIMQQKSGRFKIIKNFLIYFRFAFSNEHRVYNKERT